MKYAAAKTGNDQRRLGKVDSKVLNAPRNRRGHDPEVYRTVVDFYHRDDVSTVLPGKWDSKSIPNQKGKRVKVQKRALNNYLSNLYEKLKAQKPHLNVLLQLLQGGDLVILRSLTLLTADHVSALSI